MRLDVMRGRWYIDVFSGTGRVAKSLRREGYPCHELELKKGFDILHRLSRLRLLADVRSGKVAGAMIALPCISFSIAQHGRLRSDLFPMGLPGLPERLQAQVDLGNALLNATVQLIRACVAQGIPWILENPGSSYLFKTPAVLDLIRLGWGFVVTCDQCQYGTRWRKRTKFLVGNICRDDCARMCRQCRAHRGICSRTGKAHWHLQGKSDEGVHWTAIAAEYPRPLARALAFALLSPVRSHLQGC